MALRAVIFDVDGTLVDSNGAHVEAWGKALKRHGYEVSADRIGVEIGKGGDHLVPSVLGRKIEEKDGERLRKAEAEEFTKIARARRLEMFPGAMELVEALRARGLMVAIATSSGKEGLKVTEKSTGVEWLGRFDVVVTSDDAEETKPSPDLLEVTFKRLGFGGPECLMVGDTPYDAATARDAGAVCLGVTSGGYNEAGVLRAAGMRAVYKDASEMLRKLDEALKVASPGKALLTRAVIDGLMREALGVAREGLEGGEAPIGCVLALGDGRVIARGHNEQNATRDKIAHAEIVAFGRAVGKVKAEARDLIMVSTVEPCVMCLGAAMEASVDTVIYALDAPADGGRERVRPPVSEESQMPRIVGGVLAEEAKELFAEFLRRGQCDEKQEAFARELMEGN